MSGKYRLSILIVAAAVLALAAVCAYWVWDPVDVMRYVPRDSAIVLDVRDLKNGLENVHYMDIVDPLLDPVRRKLLAPYLSIGPGLTAMDVIGDRCVVFLPKRAASSFPQGMVMCARISSKTKLAEILASLLGKTNAAKSPADRRVRMVRTEGLDAPIFYARIDRILLISGSLDSLDLALGTPPPQTIPPRGDYPSITLKVDEKGISYLDEQLKISSKFRMSGIVGKMLQQINLVQGLEMNVSLVKDLQFKGDIRFFGSAILAYWYRGSYKAYTPRTFAMIPGRVVAALSTNYPGIAKDIPIGTSGINRIFHAAADFFDDLGSFDGDFTIACSSIGGKPEYFMFISTNKIVFPENAVDDFRKKLREKTGGETDYFGEELEGEVYRLRAEKLGPPVFIWQSGHIIALCSSESALDAFIGKLRVGSQGNFPTEKGDLFVLADASADAKAFLKTFHAIGEDYIPLLGAVSPVQFQMVLEESKITFSGSITTPK